jgi:molybdopterin-guanine dinucleotide biosynthesis protein A
MYDQPMNDLSAFVLAGGKSSRMGCDKAFLKLDEETLLQRALRVANVLTPHVWIVSDASKFSFAGPVVEDVFRDCGPLGGIHAALSASETELNLFLAVDLPFVSAELLGYLVREARQNGATVTVPETGGRLHPLCAVYRRRFSEYAQQALLRHENKIDALFKAVKTRVLSSSELNQAGFPDTVFYNLNTPQDVESLNITRT